MGKDKKYVVISGFTTTDNNRGTAALGYGSVTFLMEQGFLTDNMEIICFRFYKKFWKKKYHHCVTESIRQGGRDWKYTLYNTFELERILAVNFGILLPFTRFGRMMKKVRCVAAINGGDGFSDIYNTATFEMRLPMSKVAIGLKIPHIILPQTLGPFTDSNNYKTAAHILLNSESVFVRDDKFVSELRNLGVSYTITKDLSAYMQPEPWNIDIKKNAIGINVSGLCYSNKFQSLSGQFENYPLLIESIIKYFQGIGKTV